MTRFLAATHAGAALGRDRLALGLARGAELDTAAAAELARAVVEPVA